ncbi:hypothetical protein [Shouchella hunanensis]|uniref:DUF4179 domain-containing protein n=1 Tax=Shouchella hunanensis TaxID=766894 RepID=A0ABY7W8I4_9BACI|nr:hypothetical protein [Shouchella hunanensis]WDF05243.1 hypothetical protein PQ477_07175 [Shouchella hunanensis]
MDKLPKVVSESLNQAYREIQVSGKKKRRFRVWKQVSLTAVGLFVIGMATNEDVQASIKDLFYSNDPGVEKAVANGYGTAEESMARDEDVTLTLAHHFIDERKMGTYFTIQFDDKTVLEDVTDVSIDFRIKNGDDEYVVEQIPDTKPLRGTEASYVSSGYTSSKLLTKYGLAEIEYLFENRTDRPFPQLENALLSVESINLFQGNEVKKIDGEWLFNLENTERELLVAYRPVEKPANVEFVTTEVSATNLDLAFVFKPDVQQQLGENEWDVPEVHVRIPDGQTITDATYSITTEGNNVQYRGNFPLSSFAEGTTFIVEFFGPNGLIEEVEMEKER